MLASELKPGMAIRLESQMFKVLEAGFKAGAGQATGVVKTKLRDLSTGKLYEPHFRPDERIEELELDLQTMEFLYGESASCTFMDPESFEQVAIAREVIGPAQRFLREGMRLPVEFFEGRPVSLVFPPSVELRVVETAPAAHSQQDSTWKEATLENGVQLLVPLFIDRGEMVRVEVETARYLERVRAERKRGA